MAKMNYLITSLMAISIAGCSALEKRNYAQTSLPDHFTTHYKSVEVEIVGWVASENAYGVAGGGGLTIGTATTYSGASNVGLIGAHEFGHTLQFIGLSALSGAAGSGTEGAWGAYLGLGVLGAVAPTGAGAWWENMAGGL